MLPNDDFDRSIIKCNQLNDLILADPSFNKSARIDMILGADVFSEIILAGFIKPGDNACVLQETEFGWIISGPIGTNRKIPTESLCMTATINELDGTLKKFWEIEEIKEERLFSSEEEKCQEHFNSTVKREKNGSYTVTLPFKQDISDLGNSKRMAMADFFQLEKRLGKNETLKHLYTSYINELIERGYMRKCNSNDDNVNACYLPHHPIQKDSSTTEVRPVFDASRKTSNGMALNDILVTGPRLQDDLFDILIRFRLHKTAFVADVGKCTYMSI